MKRVILLSLMAAVASPTMAQAEAFNGLYAGGTAGYDSLSFSIEDSEDGDSEGSGSSFAGGAVIGYNAKVGGNFVVGAELEAVIGGGSLDDGTDTDYSSLATLRAGYLAGSKVLIFGKIGIASTKLSFGDDSNNGDGLAFGGGVELAFSDKLSGRVSYMRTNYKIDEDAEDDFGDDVDVNRDQIMAAVLFHF